MSKVKKAEKEYEKIVKQTYTIEHKKEKFDTADKLPPPLGRRSHFEKKMRKLKYRNNAPKKKFRSGPLKP